MVVIQKKRILFLFTCILIGIFVCALQQRNVETMQTVSLPCTNKIVILDAGHGLPDERNSLLTLKNNIDLLQKIKCFKHFIFFMLKRRLIYAKQRIW